jgi:beta-galactosidase
MVASYFSSILAYGRNTGSVSMYMAHGGTNFGFWAGSKSGMFQVTSYDYNSPISESGSTESADENGPSKFQVSKSILH